MDAARRTPDDLAREYVHGYTETVLRSYRRRDVDNSAAYLLPHLVDGQVVVDVGCGPASITADLGRRFPGSRVIGVDASSAVIESVDPRTLPPNVSLQVGDVHSLDLATLGLDQPVDVVHAHQVLQHLSDPVGALRAMAGLCRPGGLLAARDADYGAMTWAPGSRQMDRWRESYRHAARLAGGDPDAGRHLLAWALEAGIGGVEPSASVWCLASEESRGWWGPMWADRLGDPGSRLHQLLLQQGAEYDDIAAMQEAWHAWTADPAGWFAVLHGEILITTT